MTCALYDLCRVGAFSSVCRLAYIVPLSPSPRIRKARNNVAGCIHEERLSGPNYNSGCSYNHRASVLQPYHVLIHRISPFYFQWMASIALAASIQCNVRGTRLLAQN